MREKLAATPIPDASQHVAGYRLATLDYGIRAHELMARWIDELASR